MLLLALSPSLVPPPSLSVRDKERRKMRGGCEGWKVVSALVVVVAGLSHA